MRIFTTSSGVRVVMKNHPSDAVYSAVTVDCGTRNEDKSGLVHFIEHMLFKGTSARGVKSINNRLESSGGELNAYTAKEELVVHSTVLKADFRKAMDLMLEILFDSVYPVSEMEKERGVVAEEIKSYKDNPSESIYDDFEELFFRGHDLGKPILGTVKSLKGITSNDMKAYASRFFRPENIVVSVLGDVSEKKVAAAVDGAVEKYFRGEVSVPVMMPLAAESDSLPLPDVLASAEPFRVEKSRRIHQGHVICGAPAFSLHDRRRVAMSLLVNMIGGPALNSVLNRTLRDEKGLVYTVEANYSVYSDCGMFTVYFGCDKANIAECCGIVVKELDRFRNSLCSENVLKAAKKQFMGQLAISNDNLESQVLGMGKSLMVYGRVSSNEEIMNRVNAVTAEEIRDVAETVFSKLSWLVYR